MDNLSTYLKCSEALEAGDFDTAGALIHEDFRFSGVMPQPATKADLLALMRAVLAACPDFRFNYRGLEQRGREITGRQRITCTHTGRLDLSFLGIPPVEATGKRVELPEEPVSAVIEDGKMSRVHIEGVPGGGLEGFLRQVGVELPALA
jgi:hypothetical protein